MKTYYVRFGSGDPRTYTGLAATFLIFNNNGTGVTPPAIAEVTGAAGIYSFQYGVTTPICFLIDAATTSPGAAGRYVSGAIDPSDRSDEYGTTLVAIGTSVVAGQVAQGSTLVAIGSSISVLALGTTLSAIGNSLSVLALGTTLTAIGNSMSVLALGSTLSAIGSSVSVLAVGSTMLTLAVGNTMTAIGSSLMANGQSLAAIGSSIYAGLATGTSIYAAIGTTASPFGDSATDPSTLFGYLKRVQENLEGDQRFTKSSQVLTIYDRTGATTIASLTVTNNASLVARA